MRDTEVRHTAHPVVRKGFTLVELLVVITIIGLLMSLVLPAVSAARAAARAVQCKNNLHNLQYGVQLYQAQRGTFPPSWKPALPDANGNVNGWSTLGLILPYLEQVNLSDHIDYSLSYSLAPPLAGQPGKLSATRVPVFICPDEQNDYVRLKNGQPYHYPLNYAVNQGGWFTYNPATKKFGSGAFHPNSKFTGAHFRDGLSHTIAWAEVKAYNAYFRNAAIDNPQMPLDAASLCALGGQLKKDTGHTEWVDGRVHQTGFTSVFTPNHRVVCPDQNFLDVDWTNQQEGKSSVVSTFAAVTARSYHTIGVHIAMMDSSVHLVVNEVDLAVWRAITTRFGKETSHDFKSH